MMITKTYVVDNKALFPEQHRNKTRKILKGVSVINFWQCEATSWQIMLHFLVNNSSNLNPSQNDRGEFQLQTEDNSVTTLRIRSMWIKKLSILFSSGCRVEPMGHSQQFETLHDKGHLRPRRVLDEAFSSHVFSPASRPSWSKLAPKCCLSHSNSSSWRLKRGRGHSCCYTPPRDCIGSESMSRGWLGQFSLKRMVWIFLRTSSDCTVRSRGGYLMSGQSLLPQNVLEMPYVHRALSSAPDLTFGYLLC